MAEWIAAICAVLSLAGAGFSWWRSNMSRRAKEDAEAARAHAARSAEHAAAMLEETRRHTAALEAIAEANTPAPLTLEPDGGPFWLLRNTSRQEIAIDRVDNMGEFEERPLQWPVVIQPNQAIEVTILEGFGMASPTSLDLVIRGWDDVLRVPIRRI